MQRQIFYLQYQRSIETRLHVSLRHKVHTLTFAQAQITCSCFDITELKELALQVTTDPDHKFDLSLQLDDLDGALEIARSIPPPESDTKWKAIGDRALAVWRFDLARECFEKANDLSALLLLLLAVGDRPGLERLSAEAGKFLIIFMCTMGFVTQSKTVGKGQNNLAFASLLQLGDPKACVELLLKTDRAPEAALFARTYSPRYVLVLQSLCVVLI